MSNTYYYMLGGRLIGKFDGTNTQYYLTDAQGSVLTTFSNAATTTSVSGYQTYGPYGNTLASSGTMGTSKGYTGQYNDPTGLDYYNARYYDPVIGCFTSADKVVDVGFKLGAEAVKLGVNLFKKDAEKLVVTEGKSLLKQGVKAVAQDVAKACGGGLSFTAATTVATAQGVHYSK